MRNELNVMTVLETFSQNTTLKAVCLLSDYSKQMTVSGIVADVLSGADTTASVSVKIKEAAPESRPFAVTADFAALPETETYRQLIELQKGQPITVCGAIRYVAPNALNLENCEITENAGEIN